MSWRRTQRRNKRRNRGERRSDDEIRRGIRRPMPKPTRIHHTRDLDVEYEDWKAQQDLLDMESDSILEENHLDEVEPDWREYEEENS